MVEAATEPSIQAPSRTYRALQVIGWVLLLGWAGWWGANYYVNYMIGGWNTWAPRFPYLGLDFALKFLATHSYFGGGDPYTEQFDDPLGQLWPYPPVAFYVFFWVRLLPFRAGVIVWSLSIAAIIGLATWMSLRSRRELGLAPAPLNFALGAMLLSTPVIFAMERGNYDAAVLLLLVIMVIVMRRNAWAWQILAGVCLAIAIFLKQYPVFLLPCLLVLRRPRTLIAAVLACGVLGVIALDGSVASVIVQQRVMERHPMIAVAVAHSLSSAWPFFMQGTVLQQVPGSILVGVLIFPAIAYISWRIYQAPHENRLAYPYLLWTQAMVLMWTPISYDYKFFFLPLAALALWSPRDSWKIQLLFWPLVIYLQPMKIPQIPLLAMYLIKIAAMASVGMMLLARMREQKTEPA